MRNLKCRLLGHRVNRDRVWHDGISFRTKCSNCNLAMIRGRNAWRPFDPEKDRSQYRSAQPRSDEAV